MERAVALETAGDTDEALRVYREVAESPDTPQAHRANAWFRIGLLRERAGHADDAIRAWTTGAETEGNPDLSRRCAFHAACALAASGDRASAAAWLRRLLGMQGGGGAPEEQAVRWKMVAVEPLSAEVPERADGNLEALLAVEAGFALEQAGDLENASAAYRLALATGALDEASRTNADKRLAFVKERLSVRNGEVLAGASVDSLHAETWQALQSGDLLLAHRLASLMPAARPETAARIGHMLVATAFHLETAGSEMAAGELYRRAVEDEGLAESERTNAAYRLALLLAADGNRREAVEHLRLAVTSPDDAVHAAATLQLVHHLLLDEDWSGALDLCDSPRIADPAMRELLAVRSLQCRTWLDRLPQNPEQAAEALPSPVVAHAGAWMDAALACEATDNHRVARVLYGRLVRVPDLPPDIRANVQFRLGLALDRMTLWTEAQPFLREAANAAHAWPATRVHSRYRLAGIYYLLDQYGLALPEYDKLRSDADAEPPVRADAQLKYAICLYRLDRRDEAIREFRTCRAIGGEIEVKAELALAEIAETQRELTAARESYNRILQHPQATPLTKTAALQRLRDLPRR
jgi:tetratricopeptide (TPR) repeat protein